MCCRNTRADFTTPGPEQHGAGFLVARIADILPAPEPHDAGRFLIAFGEFAHIDIPNAWKGWRNPVRYTTLEEMGIDPEALEWLAVPAHVPEEPRTQPPQGQPVGVHALSIAEAKRGLAEAFGVSVDAVEITIRG